MTAQHHIPSHAERRARLATSLANGQLIVAPGVYDGLSARIADGQNFSALYMTGYGVAASLLGMPDAGYATYRDMVDRARQIVERTATPLIADADTGFGGPLNVQQTVRGYEAAGVCAIQLEDQEFPKRCGHTQGRRVVPIQEMVTKIRVAVESRQNENFLIIARTDARSSLGLDEALRRGEAYAEAGADILFVESPESEAEMARIGKHFNLPLLANMVEGGRTPLLPPARLRELGYAIVIYPVSGLLAAGWALRTCYRGLEQDGASSPGEAPLLPFETLNEVVGFGDVWDFDQRYGKQT